MVYKLLVSYERFIRLSMSNRILIQTHINSHGGSGIIVTCAIIYGCGGVIVVALLSENLDGTFEIVVCYLTVI